MKNKNISPKKNFYCGDEVDYDDKCLEQCDRCVDATGVDYGYLPEEHVELINKNIDEFDKKIKEQKQHLIDMMKQDEELGMYEEIQPEQTIKQETLEEAAENYVNYCSRFVSEDEDLADADRRGFIYGAKWQQERINSDEDIESIIAETWIQCVKNDGNNFKAARDGIIKQFKIK
jgi:hypothetical protein